eukprot:TRINITY_DN1666_c0_g1_i4.p4 TRINITY_DN1666_c0_g1~~TRINITY_DN1666_c0_g1_i4.p4  ORF type:complete len:102 (+),score=16.97 TRINITY_DN1666_c0_g1_i4:563-868(+)
MISERTKKLIALDRILSDKVGPKSEFLEEEFDRQKDGRDIKEYFNLRDPEGLRLQNRWNPGDSIFSVTKRRILETGAMIFDPDTYSKKSLRHINQKTRENV